jgi:aspartate-semialdehyde dehydrogenase
MLRKTPNIAIVGSSSLLGKELKQMLEDSEFPTAKLALFETEEYAGLLQEFAGDIQITQVISPDAFKEIDIAFFTCGPEIMNSYVGSGGRFPAVTIDLTQTRRDGTIFLHGISDPRSLKTRGYFLNPHPATIVIARLLSRLHNAFGVQSSAVTVLEPASERGPGGVDELQEQTVNLLNFQEIGSKVFNGQLAFNILPERQAAERTEGRILGQVQSLGLSFPTPVITILQAPVFHSHAFSLFVRLVGEPSPEEVVAQLQSDQTLVPVPSVPGDEPSPVTVVGSDKIHVGRIRKDANHSDAYTFWVVADNLRIAASNAIHMAENILFAPAER